LSKLLNSNGHFFLLKNQGHVGMNENEDFQKELQLILQ